MFDDGGGRCSFSRSLIRAIRFVSGTSWQVGAGSRSSVWHGGVWGFEISEGWSRRLPTVGCFVRPGGGAFGLLGSGRCAERDSGLGVDALVLIQPSASFVGGEVEQRAARRTILCPAHAS